MRALLFRNPFFLREWWVWQREMPRGQLLGTRLLFAVLMCAPFLVITASAILFGAFSFGTLKFAWGFAACLWLGALSWFTVSATIQVYQYERDLGTADIVSLTKVRPFNEVMGRWCGALIPVAEGWVMGLFLVALALFLMHRDFSKILHAWMLAGPWCAALGSLGIASASVFRTIIRSLTGVIGTLIALSLSGLAALYLVPMKCHYLVYYALRDRNSIDITTFRVPSDPVALYLYLAGNHPFKIMLISLICCMLFVVTMLGIAACAVACGFPLRGESANHPGPRGLIPSSPVLTGKSTAAPEDLKARMSTGPMCGDPAAAVLMTLSGANPFVIAYRRGFMRRFSGITAFPGSIWPPSLTAFGLLCYSLMVLDGSPETATMTLMIALLAASAISFCESLVLGNRALQAERNQSTWLMLLASGIYPGRVLEGKFATSLYALSGEWTFALPFWAIAMLCGQKYGLLLLVFIQPLMISTGILMGLWLASQPRFLILNLPRIGKVSGAVLLLWLMASIPPWSAHIGDSLRQAVLFLNPYEAALTAGLYMDQIHLLPALLRLSCFLLTICALIVLLWYSAGKRLRRIMEGE